MKLFLIHHITKGKKDIIAYAKLDLMEDLIFLLIIT